MLDSSVSILQQALNVRTLARWRGGEIALDTCINSCREAKCEYI